MKSLLNKSSFSIIVIIMAMLIGSFNTVNNVFSFAVFDPLHSSSNHPTTVHQLQCSESPQKQNIYILSAGGNSPIINSGNSIARANYNNDGNPSILLPTGIP